MERRPQSEALSAPGAEGREGSSVRNARIEFGRSYRCDRLAIARPQRNYAVADLRAWKHSLQYTGRPWVGLKGTVVSLPHWEHIAVVSTRSRVGWLKRELRLALQSLQRLGSFLKFLSA